MRQLLIFAFVAVSGAALAQTAGEVPLPRERPSPDAVSVPLPLPRPPEIDASSMPSSSLESSSDPASSSVPPSSEPPYSDASSAMASSVEPPPPPEPPRLYQTACPATLNGQVIAKSLPPIHEGQCGIQSPLAIEAISAGGRNIPLNAPVTTDCGMATALPGWLGDVEAYVEAHEKTRIKTLMVGTGYDCRNVDHAATGSLSFHSFADAVDVIGFVLEDGRTVTISPGFNGTAAQGHDILHFARDAACGRFTTVLGPDADSYHQDNMHLDLACHGKTCTVRLCE